MRWLWILVASTALAQTTPQTAAPLSASEAMKSAMEKQRAAARIQAQSTGARLIPWSPALEGGTAASAACDPMAESAATPLIESAAKANSIEPNLLRAVIDQESGFRPCAVSSKGAQGLMQLMPDTASTLGVKDTFDPKQNVEAGARYLKQLVDKYKGDLKLALGAYNAGPAAVDAAGKIPDIAETRDYVDAILKKLK